GVSCPSEVNGGIGGEVALLCIAIDDIGLVSAQCARVVPVLLESVNGPGDVTLGIDLRGPDVHDDEIVLAVLDPPVKYLGPSGKSQLVFEVSFGFFGRVQSTYGRLHSGVLSVVFCFTEP